MKVNAKVVGYGPDPETTKALVNIIIEFSGPTETMTLTVIVPNEGDEAALKEQGIARAKDFALQFAADRCEARSLPERRPAEPAVGRTFKNGSRPPTRARGSLGGTPLP